MGLSHKWSMHSSLKINDQVRSWHSFAWNHRGQHFSTLNIHVSESLGALIKTQSAGPLPRNFCLGWGLRVCMSNNSPDDAGAAGQGTIL